MRIFRNIFICVIATATPVFMSGCIGAKVKGMEISYNDRGSIKPSGKIVTKTLNLGSFNAVKLQGTQDVRITQGSAYKVVVKGSENIMKYNDISVANKELVISLVKNKPNNFKSDVVVYLTVPNLDKIVSNGTGDIEFNGTFKTGEISAVLNGTGDIEIPALNASNLKANLNGTGDIKVSAKSKEVSFFLNGTGDIDAKILDAQDLNASLSGTGDINVSGISVNAFYSVTGTGDIYAKNLKAKSVRATATGTGDITCYASESFSGQRTSITHITCYGNPKNRNFKSDGYSFPN